MALPFISFITTAFSLLWHLWDKFHIISEKCSCLFQYIPAGWIANLIPSIFAFLFPTPKYQSLPVDPAPLDSNLQASSNSTEKSSQEKGEAKRLERRLAAESFRRTLKFMQLWVYIPSIIIVAWAVVWSFGLFVNSVYAYSETNREAEMWKERNATKFQNCVKKHLLDDDTSLDVKLPCIEARNYLRNPTFGWYAHAINYVSENQHWLGLYKIHDATSFLTGPAREGWITLAVGAVGLLTFMNFLVASTDTIGYLIPERFTRHDPWLLKQENQNEVAEQVKKEEPPKVVEVKPERASDAASIATTSK